MTSQQPVQVTLGEVEAQRKEDLYLRLQQLGEEDGSNELLRHLQGTEASFPPDENSRSTLIPALLQLYGSNSEPASLAADNVIFNAIDGMPAPLSTQVASRLWNGIRQSADLRRGLNATQRLPGNRLRLEARGWRKEKLRAAASAGDVNTFRVLAADSDSALTVLESHGRQLLRLACSHGHAEVARHLVRVAPWLVSLEEVEGNTPWHICARKGHLSVLEMIFSELENDNGQFLVANKNQPIEAERDLRELKNPALSDRNGASAHPSRRQAITPRAVTHFSAVSLLEARTSSGQTLLHLACAHGHLGIVEFLLSKKADPIATCSAGRSCLRVALAGDYSEVATRLLRESIVQDTLNKHDDQGNCLLSIAASEMGEASVDLLLKAGADCTMRNRDFSTPITQAIKHEKLGNLSILLSSDCARANMEYAMTYVTEDRFNSTALHLACECNSLGAVGLLVKHGAVPNVPDRDGRNALHEASRLGRGAIVSALVNNFKHLDLNVLDGRGLSAFHYACTEGLDDDWSSQGKNLLDSEGKMEIIHLGSYAAVILHLKDADWFKPTANGDYFIHLAAQKGNANRLRYLLKLIEGHGDGLLYLKGACGLLPLERALQNEHAAVVELLTDKMRSIMLHPSFDREDLLMWLTKTPETRDVLSKVLRKELLAQGRGPPGPDLDALGWATLSGSARLVWRLLQCSTPGQALECSIREAITAANTAKKYLSNDPFSSSPTGRSATKESGDVGGGGEQEMSMDKKRAIGNCSPTVVTAKTLQDLDDILSILHNPPATSRPVRDSALDQGPHFDAESQPARFVEELKVQLVDCCKDSLLRRSASVKEALYDKGPISIMQTGSKRIRELHEQFNVGKQCKAEKNPREPAGDGVSKGAAKDGAAASPAQNVLWIHLPANNMKWHEDACLKVNSELKYRDDEGNFQCLSTSWDEVIGNGLRTNLMKPLCTTRFDEFDEGQPKCAAIYMPYVAPAWPMHETETNPDAFLSHYQSKNWIIHGSRTLDEYFYHSCRWMSMEKIMEARNGDQILSKSLEGQIQPTKLAKPAILVNVDQLWIWIPNKDVIITSATHRQDGECDPVFTAAFDALQKVIHTNDETPSDAFEMANFVMNACRNLFSRRFSMNSTRVRTSWSAPAGGGGDPRDRQSFSVPAASDVERGVKREHTEFRERVAPNPLSRVCIKEAFTTAIAEAVAMEIGLYERFIEQQRDASQSSARGGHSPLSRNDRAMAARLFREIKDIRDELKILRIIAVSQRSVQKEFHDLVKMKPRKIGDRDVVDELHDLDKTVEQIETSVSITLNLQQNATSISQTDVAVYQGQIMLVFTVATIIFLPMSFFASLFALQVDSFLNTPRWAFGVLFGASSIISILLGVYAFCSEGINAAITGICGRFIKHNERHGNKETQVYYANTEDRINKHNYFNQDQAAHKGDNTNEGQPVSYPLPHAMTSQGSLDQKHSPSNPRQFLLRRLPTFRRRASTLPPPSSGVPADATVHWRRRPWFSWSLRASPTDFLPRAAAAPASQPSSSTQKPSKRMEMLFFSLRLRRWAPAVRQWLMVRWPQRAGNRRWGSPPASTPGSQEETLTIQDSLETGSGQMKRGSSRLRL